MTREETKKIIRIISVTYPNWHPDNLTDVVDVWTMYLEEFTYQEVSVALKAFTLSNTSGFAPSIGQLVGMMQKVSIDNQELGEMEAWALVSKAIRNGTYGYREEFDKLPESVQIALGSPEQIYRYATDEGYNESVIQSHFRSSYRAVVDRQREIARLPKSMKVALVGQNKETPKLITNSDEDIEVHVPTQMSDEQKEKLKRLLDE